MSHQVFINIPPIVQDAMEVPPPRESKENDTQSSIPDLETSSSLREYRNRNHGLGHYVGHNLDNALVYAGVVQSAIEDPVGVLDYMQQPVPLDDDVKMEEFDLETNDWRPISGGRSEPRWRRNLRDLRNRLREQRHFSYPTIEENRKSPYLDRMREEISKKSVMKPFSLVYHPYKRHSSKYRRKFNVLYFQGN